MINTVNWKPYRISEIFSLSLAKGDCQLSKLPLGDIPLVTSGFTNQGIAGYVSCGDDKTELIPSGTITVDMFGNSFYRGYDYYCVSHGRVIILSPKAVINYYTGMFIAVAIHTVTSDKYSFARMCSLSNLPNETIKLPTQNGKIDYEYMENYVKSLNIDVADIPDYFLNEGYNKDCWYLANIDVNVFESNYSKSKTTSTIRLTDKCWSYFRLGDKKYFEIVRGESEYIKNLNIGDFPYISTTNENNGISTYVSISNRKGNLITLAYDGSIGACFYQPKPFFASEKIVTIDLVQHELNIYIAMFLIPIIQLESQMYSYGGRKWTVDKQMKNTTIKLPVDNEGNPDYKFMEDYIKSLPFSCKL